MLTFVACIVVEIMVNWVAVEALILPAQIPKLFSAKPTES